MVKKCKHRVEFLIRRDVEGHWWAAYTYDGSEPTVFAGPMATEEDARAAVERGCDVVRKVVRAQGVEPTEFDIV